jgi:Zn-dependent protease with chaperone function
MVKFIFKRQISSDPLNTEILKHQHPRLFDFIRCLCRETKTPFPKKIFVNHEVNAYVFYSNSIFNLFLPKKKNLLVGLGLINFLNLSEFKAILAHELGHFSQSSMKLGTYTYTANRIIYDMVHVRDRWDDILDGWRRSEALYLILLSLALLSLTWILRQLLALCYLGLNALYAALSRQMEYQADLVAVSACGSDAVVNALSRLEFAEQCLQFAQRHLMDASDHQLYTTNIFFHQGRAKEQLKQVDPNISRYYIEMKSDSARMIFSPQRDLTPTIYDSHPSNYQRELSIKKRYIKCREDNRQAWELFSNVSSFCEKITINLYQNTLPLPPDTRFSPPEKVNGFIEAEVGEMYFDQKYGGIYDNRFITAIDLGKADQLVRESSIDRKKIVPLLDEIYGSRVKERLKTIRQRNQDLEKVTMILNGADTGKTFKIGYMTYRTSQAKQVYRKLIEMAKKDELWLARFDKMVFLTHYQIMAVIGGGQKEELIQRYTFHFDLQDIYRQIQERDQQIHTLLGEITERDELTELEVENYSSLLFSHRQEVARLLDACDKLKAPELSNMAQVRSIRGFLLEKQLAEITVPHIDGSAINLLVEQVGLILDRIQRLHFKSLGGILNLQERVSDQFLMSQFCTG